MRRKLFEVADELLSPKSTEAPGQFGKKAPSTFARKNRQLSRTASLRSSNLLENATVVEKRRDEFSSFPMQDTKIGAPASSPPAARHKVVGARSLKKGRAPESEFPARNLFEAKNQALVKPSSAPLRPSEEMRGRNPSSGANVAALRGPAETPHRGNREEVLNDPKKKLREIEEKKASE